jgi:hypothetical protein
MDQIAHQLKDNQNVFYLYKWMLFSNKKGMKYWYKVQHEWILKTVKEANQRRPYIVWFHLYETFRVGKERQKIYILVIKGNILTREGEGGGMES